MSVVGGGDFPRPTSPHADVILGTLWPLQSESAWHGFASAIKSEAIRLFQEDGAQQDILRLVATDQAGAFIEAATRLVSRLQNRPVVVAAQGATHMPACGPFTLT